MNAFFVVCKLFFFGLLAVSANAQLLPDNNNLNVQSVNRWMQSNRDMAPLVQAVDAYHLTPESFKTFEALSPLQQDEQIERVLREANLMEQATKVARQHGWKSIGEYMRLSTKLGNAIAAYFLLGDLGKVTEEQAKELKEKADPAVLAVPQADIDFIRRNEKTLQQYIQAYSAGR
ncbi:hypothetical protein [Cellvibrio fontiphilus]|uniref:Secreted protein n=1 Tax=Cellvibrio fontiphilus TaxID=1815559 RepID=A0ABV7FM04_9GAMM